jgi:transposase-like protein
MIKKKQENRDARKTEKHAEIETHSYEIKCPICFHKHFKIEKAVNKSEYDLTLRCFSCNYMLYLTLGEFLKLTNPKNKPQS